jgi:hypothetical protein
VVLEVLREISETTSRLDRLDSFGPLGPLELRQFLLESSLLGRREVLQPVSHGIAQLRGMS